MSFNRTKNLVSAIEWRLSTLKVTGIDADRILELLNKVEFKLCQDYCAAKRHSRMILEAGTNTYSLSGRFHKISAIILPINWSVKELQIIVTSSSWVEFISNNPYLSGNPVAMFVWDKYAYFHPTPAVTGDELDLFYYGLSSKKIDLNTEPELEDGWDEALEWGVVSEVVPEAFDKFNSLASTRMNSMMNETAKGVIRRKHSSDNIGY